VLQDGDEEQSYEQEGKAATDAQLKAKVAREAVRNEATIAELAVQYQLHVTRSSPGRSSCSTVGQRFSRAGTVRGLAAGPRSMSPTPKSTS
jgi:hypothetical protein